MKVGLVGCGLIGRKRVKALDNATLIACTDVVKERAQQVAAMTSGCQVFDDWRAVIQHPQVKIVIVATYHSVLSEITLTAVQAGKHVLVEKPAACTAKNLEPVIKAAKERKILVRVGFNHRYHPALLKARELVDEGVLGDLMFLRARYGHGGRLGYEKEWRAQPKLSGGGELIDQGMHLIDLSRWFLGDFTTVMGDVQTYFWRMPVEDNAFLLLQTEKRKTAFLHASCTEWKNLFSFEIYGRTGKIAIDGLGGSYGVEKLNFYKMLPQMGPPETFSFEYPESDDSWTTEFQEFLEDIRIQRQPSVNLADAQAALTIVETIYKRSKLKEPVYDYYT